MSDEANVCQGQIDGLMPCSVSLNGKTFRKFLWRIRATFAHFMWHLRTKGLLQTLELTLHKTLQSVGIEKKGRPGCQVVKKDAQWDEVLDLRPGEWVEVKSEQEIMATLNEKNQNKGLLWMRNMREHCGKRYRVFKKLETILLESNGELRKMKNTVLLEDTICDGKDFFGCVRSCFHYW